MANILHTTLSNNKHADNSTTLFLSIPDERRLHVRFLFESESIPRQPISGVQTVFILIGNMYERYDISSVFKRIDRKRHLHSI